MSNDLYIPLNWLEFAIIVGMLELFSTERSYEISFVPLFAEQERH